MGCGQAEILGCLGVVMKMARAGCYKQRSSMAATPCKLVIIKAHSTRHGASGKFYAPWLALCARRLFATQRAQQLLPASAIDWHTQPALLCAYGLAGFGTNQAIGLANIMATRQQQGLQLAVFGARQASIIGWPCGGKSHIVAVARKQIRQVRYGQCVVFAGVVAVERIEVFANQKSWPLCARW